MYGDGVTWPWVQADMAYLEQIERVFGYLDRERAGRATRQDGAASESGKTATC